MVEFLCLFLPPFLSFRNDDDKLGSFFKLKKYIKYNILTNSIVLSIIFLKSSFRDLEVNKMFTISVTPKYLVLASLVAYFLPVFLAFINKNYSFDIKKIRKNARKKASRKIGKKEIIKIVLKSLLMFLILLLYFSVKWAIITYDKLTFEEIIFNITYDVAMTASSILSSYFTKAFVPTIICILFIIVLFISIFYYVNNSAFKIKIKIGRKNFKFDIFEENIKRNMKRILFYILIFILFYSFYEIKIGEYIIYCFKKSSFIEENYVDPSKVKITFPSEKRNLIYIYVESLESSYFSKELGGLKSDNILANLTDLTNENINFSNSKKFGGAFQVDGVSWTMAGMVSQTAGLPLKMPINVSNYKKYDAFLPGAYTLGDILEKEGYNQMLMIGSDGRFGNRLGYFKQHGKYDVFDYNAAIEDNLIPDDYYVWWGIEDSKLFTFAKDKIGKLADKKEPFNFTILTTNTHFTDGYLEDDCESIYSLKYSNSIHCSAGQIANFISWIKEQDFYDNTTIVIAGDHLTMQSGYFEADEDDKRTVYNLFINSAKEGVNLKNRQFTTMDYYPTTISALGADIEGDRLALGTDLFSETDTLIEKYGIKVVNDELKKTSKFYNKNILK